MAYTIDVEPADFIWLDLFPAKISQSATFQPVHEEYRVIVTNNYFYLLDDTIDGPQAIIKEPLKDFSGSNKVGYTVTTETDTYLVERAINCGCGSRLRGLHPFAGVPYAARNIRK